MSSSWLTTCGQSIGPQTLSKATPTAHAALARGNSMPIVHLRPPRSIPTAPNMIRCTIQARPDVPPKYSAAGRFPAANQRLPRTLTLLTLAHSQPSTVQSNSAPLSAFRHGLGIPSDCLCVAAAWQMIRAVRKRVHQPRDAFVLEFTWLLSFSPWPSRRAGFAGRTRTAWPRALGGLLPCHPHLCILA